MLSEPSGNKTGPSRSHRVRSFIGPDRRRTLAYSSAYAPTTPTVRMQLAAPAVSSFSVDEVQPASCCWRRRRPAGVTAETTRVCLLCLTFNCIFFIFQAMKDPQ